MEKGVGVATLLAFTMTFSCSSLAATTTNTHRNTRPITCRKIRQCNRQGKQCRVVVHCEKRVAPVRTSTQEDEGIEQQATELLTSITPEKTSPLQERIKREEALSQAAFGIVLFRPNYVLPFYHTASPLNINAIQPGTTPDNQPVRSTEFKGQLSFRVPIFRNFFGPTRSLNFAYTQVSYWQLYTESPYFRETNYEPEFFFSDNFLRNWLFIMGVVHQSNGRGGALERSWNRAYIDIRFSGANWMVSLKPWLLIFQNDSSNLHNPDITRFMGYGRILLAYKCYNQVFSLMIRNFVYSGFRRGTVEFTYSFPLHGRVRGFVQFFSGYGQSLIEYNHHTNAIGVGVALNDWI